MTGYPKQEQITKNIEMLITLTLLLKLLKFETT